MKVKINDRPELELKCNLRAFHYYEDLFNKSFSFDNLSMGTIIELYYAIIVASMQRAGMDMDITWEEFQMWVDGDDLGEGIERLTEFSKWITSQLEAAMSFVNVKLANDKTNKKDNITEKKTSKNV